MPKTKPEPLPARLRRLRAEAGLTQSALAGRASVAVTVIRDLEQGRKTEILATTALALSRALGVSVEELLA